jgi:ABC-type multidrug transport system ATPase subunit
MSAPAISAESLTLIRGGRQLCIACDLGIPTGRLSVIVGPNGSGKTTLLEALAGLRRPAHGQVEHRVDPPLGYLPQRPRFRGGFSLLETIGYYRELAAPGAPTSAADVLDRVGLGGRAHDPVEALSGGMTRLLGVAVALVGDPQVLLLDEPTGGLDPQMRDAILAIVRQERDSGRAVVMVTHALEAVDPITDEVVVMGDATSVRTGAKAALLEATGTRTLAGLYQHLMVTDA